MKLYAHQRLQSFNQLSQKILEGLNGFRDIKIYNKESFFLPVYGKIVDSVCRSLYKIANLNQTPRYLVEFLSICILLIVMLINLDGFEKNRTYFVITEDLLKDFVISEEKNTEI